MARSKVAHVCETCGASFMGWTGRNRNRYCSRECYHAQDRARAIIRFWSRVKKTATCWLWTGRRDKDGYGTSGIGRANRVAWEYTHGPVPEGLSILHSCDNPPCVRPDHLYAGTPAKNMEDRAQRGHYDIGEAHPMAILTETKVHEIRATYVPRKNGGMIALGQRFGVGTSTIQAIISRKIWKHI